MDEIINFYKTNANFRKYVDKYCNTYRISNEEALKHELVTQTYLYYLEGGEME